MEPFMEKQDIPIFYKYLDKAKNYLEYGSGGSTHQASLRPNIKSITSIESDKQWIETLKDTRAFIIFVDIDSQPNSWGHPGKRATLENIRLYSSPHRYTNQDLILIDGRFRVACALKLWEHINESTNIIFDDFLDRQHYHIILDYFNIIEKGKRLVVLRKNNTKPSFQIISHFELDPR